MKIPLLICCATATTAFSAAEPPPQIFRMLDLDGDGKVIASEVKQSPWVARLDKDKDGGVSSAEFTVGWGEFAELRAALAARFPEAMGYRKAAPVQESPRQAAKVLAANEAGIG